MVNHLKVTILSIHKYVFSFPKRHLELGKLGEIMETKDLMILNNVKTLLMFMLNPFKWALQDHPLYLLNMALDNPMN
jgi:hypothetical protein